MSSDKNQIPANIRQEIRSCIAVKLLSTIFKMSKMTTRNIYDKMFEMFHGTSNDAYAHLDQLLKGVGPYEAMFEKRTQLVTRGLQESNTSLVLSTKLFIIESEYIVGKHIVKRMLECLYSMYNLQSTLPSSSIQCDMVLGGSDIAEVINTLSIYFLYSIFQKYAK